MPQRGGPASLVGRTEELAALADAFDAVADSGLVTVLVGGDPGVGKTRLVEGFVDRLGTAVVSVHWGRSAEIGGSPAFWPWIQVLRSMGGTAVDAARERLSSRADEPFVAFDTVLEVLRAQCAAPTVIVLEDLHAADLPSLELLRFLADHGRDLPLLLVGTHRLAEVRGEPERDVLLAEVGRRGLRLDVPALGLDDVLELLEARAGSSLGPDVATAVLARSGGNALYVTHLVEAIAAGGPERLAEIPSGIRAAVRARLLPLCDAARAALRAASILGQPFSAAVVGAMTGVAEPDARAALAAAVDAGLLAEVPGGLAFEHALVRDAVVDDLTGHERRSLHAAAAEALAMDGDATLVAAVVATHLVEAQELAPETEVARWAERAAASARRLGALREEARWHDTAAAAWGRTGDLGRQGDALRAAARSLVAVGDAEAALRATDVLVDLAERTGSGPLLAQAALARADVFEPAQELDAPPLLLDALAHPDVTDPAVRSELLSMVASLLGMPSFDGPRRDGVTARQALAELEGLAAGGDPVVRGHLAVARLNVDSGPAFFHHRQVWRAEFEAALPAGPGVFDRLDRTYWATSLAFEAGDLGEVERRLQEWELLAERADSQYWRWRVAMVKASLAYARGRLAEAEAIALAAQPLMATLNPTVAFRAAYGLLFAVRRDQGRLGELLGGGEDQVGILGALVSTESGERPKALRRLDRLVAQLEGTGPDDAYWLCLHSMLAYTAPSVGDRELCRRLAAALTPYVDQFVLWGRAYVFGSPVAEAAGAAHRGAGDLPAAAVCYRTALAWAESAGAPGFAIRARIGLASVLPPHDPERDDLVGNAREAATRLGFGRALLEVEALEQDQAVVVARASSAPVVSARPPAMASPVVRVVPDPGRARVRTLGRFEVVGAGVGEVSRWSSRKARDTLKLLIARRGRALPREELIELLWPDVDLATARTRLSVVLSTVRAALDPERVLPSDPLRADRQSVALDLALVSVDLEEYLEVSAAALAAAERGEPGALDLVQAAVALGEQGSFLAEDPYVDWAVATREAVERTRRDVLRSAARAAGASGGDPLPWWARLVELDPDDLAASETLVTLLDEAGRHGEAEARRRAARERLRQLGLGDPS